MKSFIKNNLHIIIPTLCLILCVAIVLPITVYRVEGRVIGYDYSVTTSPSAAYSVAYDVKEDSFVPTDSNAYLVLPVPSDKEINDVRIAFKSPLKSDCAIKLIYGNENTPLSEENAIIKTVKKGSVEYYCTLDTDVYNVIECYIPIAFEMESIILSHVTSSEPTYEVVVNKPTLITALSIAFGVYALSVAALVVYRKKRK